MNKTNLSPKEVQQGLQLLGYYDGKIDGDLSREAFRDILKKFQVEYSLTVDGWYGEKTEGKLQPLLSAYRMLATTPTKFKNFLRWTGTYYYIGEQASHFGQDIIPIVSPKKKFLANVTPETFAEAALEGTTKLRDGRLLNVGTNPSYLPCDSTIFAPVFNYAQRNHWIPNKPGYAGIQCDPAGTKAVAARTFNEIKGGPNGFPVISNTECTPFKTLAADTGTISSHDPKFKGKGGVVPKGTKVLILEFIGKTCPNGQGGTFLHDGWFTVNDTGGGIFGAHFDVFTGFKSLAKLFNVPHRLHIWFEGCEDKLGMHYSFGL